MNDTTTTLGGLALAGGAGTLGAQNLYNRLAAILGNPDIDLSSPDAQKALAIFKRLANNPYDAGNFFEDYTRGGHILANTPISYDDVAGVRINKGERAGTVGNYILSTERKLAQNKKLKEILKGLKPVLGADVVERALNKLDSLTHLKNVRDSEAHYNNFKKGINNAAKALVSELHEGKYGAKGIPLLNTKGTPQRTNIIDILAHALAQPESDKNRWLNSLRNEIPESIAGTAGERLGVSGTPMKFNDLLDRIVKNTQLEDIIDNKNLDEVEKINLIRNRLAQHYQLDLNNDARNAADYMANAFHRSVAKNKGYITDANINLGKLNQPDYFNTYATDKLKTKINNQFKQDILRNIINEDTINSVEGIEDKNNLLNKLRNVQAENSKFNRLTQLNNLLAQNVTDEEVQNILKNPEEFKQFKELQKIIKNTGSRENAIKHLDASINKLTSRIATQRAPIVDQAINNMQYDDWFKTIRKYIPKKDRKTLLPNIRTGEQFKTFWNAADDATKNSLHELLTKVSPNITDSLYFNGGINNDFEQFKQVGKETPAIQRLTALKNLLTGDTIASTKQQRDLLIDNLIKDVNSNSNWSKLKNTRIQNFINKLDPLADKTINGDELAKVMANDDLAQFIGRLSGSTMTTAPKTYNAMIKSMELYNKLGLLKNIKTTKLGKGLMLGGAGTIGLGALLPGAESASDTAETIGNVAGGLAGAAMGTKAKYLGNAINTSAGLHALGNFIAKASKKNRRLRSVAAATHLLARNKAITNLLGAGVAGSAGMGLGALTGGATGGYLSKNLYDSVASITRPSKNKINTPEVAYPQAKVNSIIKQPVTPPIIPKNTTKVPSVEAVPFAPSKVKTPVVTAPLMPTSSGSKQSLAERWKDLLADTGEAAKNKVREIYELLLSKLPKETNI